MRIEAGQIVLLGRTSYTLTEKLGSGAVADVYRATLAGVPTDVVVKVVRQDTTPDEEGQRKIEGVRREGQVLATLNQAEDPVWGNTLGIPDRVRRAQQTASQRLVVALFDSGEMDPDQPYLVQELAPPALERFDVETLADEKRILSVAHAMARAMALAHQHNLALRDFDPRTKLDRVRMRWLDEEDRFEFKLIDWNITGGPEDVPQDLFYFGGHLYYLLLGRHLVLDVAGRPPANLGLGVPGWEWLTEGSREILQRLLHRDPVRRYRRAVELEADLAWWLDALHQADTPNAIDRLQDRIWQARPQERHDRVLAVADLAQRLGLTTEARRMFELWADQARQELEKETWLPIADARVSLLSGAYMAAVEKFSTQLRQLDERSEAARMARVLKLQAQAGHLLKQANQGDDIRPTDEWASLTRAAQALLQRQWDAAQNALQKHTALLTWQPVVEQLALAEAGLLFNEAADASAQAEPRRADADRADWVTVEAGHLEQLGKAINLLQQAVKKAPKEPDFKDRLQTEQARLELRQALLTRYRDAEQFREQATSYLQRGQDAGRRNDAGSAATAFTEALQALDNALTEFRAILEADAGQYRARRLQEQVQRQRGEAQHHQDLTRALTQVHKLVQRGQYNEASGHARRAADLSPDWEGVPERLAEVEVGARLEYMTKTYLETVEQYLETGNLEQANSLGQQVLHMHNQRLADLIDEPLPPVIGVRLFVLQPELNEQAAALLDQARFTGEIHDQVKDALSRGDYGMVLATLERKAEQRYSLTTQETQWQDQARSRLEDLQQAQTRLDQAQTFDDLRQILELVPVDDLSPLAAEIRYRTGAAWRRLVTMEPDPGKATRLLREGQGHFGDLEKVVETLGAMLELAELGRRIQSQFEIAPARDLPGWFDWSEPELQARIAQLEDNLAKLIRYTEWPALQKTARGWRSQLVEHLTAYLRPRRDQAQIAVSEWDFDKALNVAQRAWDLVPEELRPNLPPDVGRDGIDRIIKGVQIRKGAESRLRTLVQALVEGKRSFIETAEGTQAISLPDGVPTDDLRTVITELERGVTWEQARRRVPDVDTYAEVIHERRALASEAISPLDEKWVRLGEPLERSRERLKTSIREVRRSLMQTLRQEAKTLAEHPERSPERLLKLYWQARWLAVTRREDERTIWNERQPTVKSLADNAIEGFSTMRHHDDLVRVQNVLETLQVLNAGLSAMSKVDIGPPLELPPLPQEVEYKSLPPPLSDDAIKRFRQGVDELRKLAGRRSLSDETGPLPTVLAPPTDVIPSDESASPDVTSSEETAPPEPAVAVGTVWGSEKTSPTTEIAMGEEEAPPQRQTPGR